MSNKGYSPDLSCPPPRHQNIVGCLLRKDLPLIYNNKSVVSCLFRSLISDKTCFYLHMKYYSEISFLLVKPHRLCC